MLHSQERAAAGVTDKMSFSCCAEDHIAGKIRQFDRKWMILSGIETHICVMQTALDLMRGGNQVAVVADAVGTRRAEDHQRGLLRMEKSGALIITTEMLIYELLTRSDDPSFKRILALIKRMKP